MTRKPIVAWAFVDGTGRLIPLVCAIRSNAVWIRNEHNRKNLSPKPIRIVKLVEEEKRKARK